MLAIRETMKPPPIVDLPEKWPATRLRIELALPT